MILKSAKLIVEQICKFGHKYKLVAEERLKEIEDPQLKKDLERIIETVDRVPQYPAETFHQAIQSLWFAHIFNTWEDGINANSIGRIDQILYPYYKKDIEMGRITQEEAFELLACLWIKLYRD